MIEILGERSPKPRRHLSLQLNRAIAPALAEAIDKMEPEHPNFQFWQERRRLLEIVAEIA